MTKENRVKIGKQEPGTPFSKLLDPHLVQHKKMYKDKEVQKNVKNIFLSEPLKCVLHLLF
jgi:hypothetical protein